MSSPTLLLADRNAEKFQRLNSNLASNALRAVEIAEANP